MLVGLLLAMSMAFVLIVLAVMVQTTLPITGFLSPGATARSHPPLLRDPSATSKSARGGYRFGALRRSVPSHHGDTVVHNTHHTTRVPQVSVVASFSLLLVAAAAAMGLLSRPKVTPEGSKWHQLSAAADMDATEEALEEEEEYEVLQSEVVDDFDDLPEDQVASFELEARRVAATITGELILPSSNPSTPDPGPIPTELLPKIAIVGLPNVGKSELFNRLAGEAKAVVHNTPGVTRDRMYARGDWAGKEFVVIDTGGLTKLPEEMRYGLVDNVGTVSLPREIERQAAIALGQSDVAIFVVDGRQAVNAGDAEIAEWLKNQFGHKPIFMAVNKCESEATLAGSADFWKYGLEPVPISAKHGNGVGDFLDLVIARLPPPRKAKGTEVNPNATEIRVAIVGRPNVGKSSLLNAIVGEERAVVSDIAGTTRDAVDTLIVGPGGRVIRLVDTAGIRKKAKVGARSNKDTFEHISVASALKAMKQADVVLLVVDASEKIPKQDFLLAELISQEGRACVIVVNKWDTVDQDTVQRKKLEEDTQACLRPVSWAPVVFTSATKKSGIAKLLRTTIAVADEHARRLTTATLNIVVREAFALNMVSAPSGRRSRIYYATQVAVRPPTFLLFVNDTGRFIKDASYRQHVEKQLRQAVGFEGTPIRFLWRASRNAPRRPPPSPYPTLRADPKLAAVS